MTNWLKYTNLAGKCLILGVILYGVFSFYFTVSDFNDRLNDSDEMTQEMLLRLNFLEAKVNYATRCD